MMDRGYYFPYRLELARLEAAAAIIGQYEHFGAFSKKHTQVNTFICKIIQSSWEESEEGVLLYKVTANRFLRGMVRGLVGTMLRVGTGKIGVEELMGIIEGGDQRRADFSVPPQGLFLMRVDFQKD
jgi:tRNA pseudouridine38-40 synthase